MKIPRKDREQGFTLVEMVGVLAVIAVLAAMLVPKIFEAINNARINNAVESINTMRQAVADHYSKWSRFSGATGSALTTNSVEAAAFDSAVLMPEGRIDKLFSDIKIGNGTSVIQLRPGDSSTPSDSNSAYDLNGDGLSDTGTAQFVVEAKIPGTTADDAKAVNDIIDGVALGSLPGVADLKGRVKIPAIAAGGTGTMLVYLTHR